MKPEDDKHPPDDMIQKIIDPITGRDITGESIQERLTELDVIAEEIIQRAMIACRKNPKNLIEIYKNAYWKIHQKLGMGSIGPATAAAGPLMNEKKEKLANILRIPKKNREG